MAGHRCKGGNHRRFSACQGGRFVAVACSHCYQTSCSHQISLIACSPFDQLGPPSARLLRRRRRLPAARWRAGQLNGDVLMVFLHRAGLRRGDGRVGCSAGAGKRSSTEQGGEQGAAALLEHDERIERNLHDSQMVQWLLLGGGGGSAAPAGRRPPKLGVPVSERQLEFSPCHYKAPVSLQATASEQQPSRGLAGRPNLSFAAAPKL